jgi:hypothetical protein
MHAQTDYGEETEEQSGRPAYERTYQAIANQDGKFTVLLDPVPVTSSTVMTHTVR